MTFRYQFTFNSFSRHQGAYEKTVYIRGKNMQNALDKFVQKFGKIKIKSIDGVPFEELKQEGLSWNAGNNL